MGKAAGEFNFNLRVGGGPSSRGITTLRGAKTRISVGFRHINFYSLFMVISIYMRCFVVTPKS